MTQDDGDLVVVQTFLNAIELSGAALSVHAVDRDESILVLGTTATAVDPEPA